MSEFLSWTAYSVLSIGLIFIAYNIYIHRTVSTTKKTQTLVNPLKKEKTVSVPISTTSYPVPQSIINPDEDTLHRGDWVRRLTSHVYTHRHNGHFNVLTINNSIEHHFTPEGLIEKLAITYTNSAKPEIIHFNVFVFRKRFLIRVGDGGYLNWCFEGNFDRSDNQVVFEEIG